MIRVAVLTALICMGYPCVGSLGAPRVPHESFRVQVPASAADVLDAVEAVTRDPVIHGTYQFEKDRTLTGAKPAESSSFFGVWRGPGKAFYKVADGILSPVGFKDSADVGIISVRYVVQPVDANHTTVTIDAVFVESAHRAIHPSEGGVESAEYSAIREQLERIGAEQRKVKQELKRVTNERGDAPIATNYAPTVSVAPGSATQELERQVLTLRRMVQARVRGSGTLLKAAPYKSAATLTSLPLNSEVVVLILTRYWYGVETVDGHRGWVHRDQVEALP